MTTNFVLRSSIVFALIWSLTACIPAPYGPYYKPSYPDKSATLVKQYCGGHAGPPSVLKFSLAEKLNFKISSDHEQSSLKIDINVPEDTQIQFMSQAVTVYEGDINQGRSDKAALIVNASRELNITALVDFNQYAPIPSAVMENLLQANPKQVTMRTNIDFTLGGGQFYPQRLILSLPEINQDDAALSLPVFTMEANTQDKGWWRYETLETTQVRNARYQRCIEQTPQQACKNILEVLDESFRKNIDNLEIYGRAYIADYSHIPFKGRVNIISHSLSPWKFNTSIITGKDAVSGETLQHHIKNFSVSFGTYQVPLDTPITGISPANKASTTASIKVDLGTNSQGKWLIQLPPLRINGKIHELQPIELKLKLFDGGFEPFNC